MLDRIRRQIWIWPLLFAVLLAAFGWTTLHALQRTMREQVRSELETTRQAATAALRIWHRETLSSIELIARDPRVVGAVGKLVADARRSGESAEAVRAAPEQTLLARLLGDFARATDLTTWGLLTASGFMLASENTAAIGKRPPTAPRVIAPVLEGRPVLTPPIQWVRADEASSALVTMIGAAPVRDDAGEVIAVLGFAVDPAGDFSQILGVARPGSTGETYAFDAEGTLVSHSRFEDELRAIGLLPDDTVDSSALAISIRDPGGDLTAGFAPTLAPRARPLTRMAASAVGGETGADLEGYRDYRGVPVVGAWTWLPELALGVATEIDVEEAYAGLRTVRTRLVALIGLLALGGLGMFAYSFIVVRLQSQVAEARRLGRYTIERKLGKGGMGTVYLARHALLRRPTAIKVLDRGSSDTEGVARFEREVQVSSALSHPNTIEIYDYGYTPDGTFYYAMELLRGITIGTCVETDGPQCEARVRFVVEQACASLAEAHRAGLIHRDLKPSNIMLCERGGLLDFVKVLDFGLVRQQTQSQDVALTSVNALTGTPLYMSPEAVEHPEEMDARSDVYQLGAILYYMLTGTHVFTGDSPVEVLAKHISEPPEPLSKRLGRPISPALEEVVLRALAKRPADRPADAGALLEALEACPVDAVWTQSDARIWWARWTETYPEGVDGEGSTTGTIPSAWEVDIHRRQLEG
jgi:hypothetical protein